MKKTRQVWSRGYSNHSSSVQLLSFQSGVTLLLLNDRKAARLNQWLVFSYWQHSTNASVGKDAVLGWKDKHLLSLCLDDQFARVCISRILISSLHQGNNISFKKEVLLQHPSHCRLLISIPHVRINQPGFISRLAKGILFHLSRKIMLQRTNSISIQRKNALTSAVGLSNL